MTALIVAGCVLAALLLLGLIKCRAEAGCDESGIWWSVAVGPIPLAPRQKSERAPKQEKQAGPSPDKNARPRPSLPQLRDLAELALRLLKRFFKRLRIELLRVHFLSAFDDPYDTAMAYGYAGEAMEAMTTLADGRIRHLDLRTELDFDSVQSALTAQIRLTVRLGALFTIAISAFFSFLSLKRRWKKQPEKENEHGKSVDR